MKLSLSWIKSHIVNNADLLNPHDIHTLLSEKTTEIESFTPFTLDCTEYELVQIKSINEKTLRCLSQNETLYELPTRSDALIDQWYLIKKKNHSWITVSDLGTDKEGLLIAIAPETFCKEKVYHDFIITIDNKAITHRPDLWGHRGFAREVAALFDLQLIPIEKLIADTTVTKSTTHNESTNDGFTLAKQTDACSKIAFCSIECKSTPSDFNQARLLASIDIRPINYIVDSTNYVMADIGHPMHAFDQTFFPNKSMIVRMAKNNESIQLLDGSIVQLSEHDIVIANEQKPVSLAGVLGGKESGITKNTEKILIEAAHFDGTTIRKTAQRHKKRTDASTRFEKELDAHNTTIALQRFLYLIKKQHKNLPNHFNIHVIGKEKALQVVSLEHRTIESMIGIAIDQKEVISILTKLEFQVQTNQKNYLITIPSFRATNQHMSEADIIEEIARHYGYNNIRPKAISIPSAPRVNKKTSITSVVKNFSAFSLSLHELNSYAFFDETFIEKIGYKPTQTVSIQNPISENWKNLNTSLIPHLLKAIHDNCFDHSEINFFEIAPIWIMNNQHWSEQLTYAAAWYDQTGKKDFYDYKEYVNALFNLYGITIEWQQQVNNSPWFEPYQSASLIYKEQNIGYAGILNKSIHTHISKHLQSTLFCVEFSFDWYIKAQQPIIYSPVSCYQKVHRDLSIFIHKSTKFDTIKSSLTFISNLIEKIDLIEFLEKDDWKDQRALTIRITFVDKTKTLTKEIIDNTMNLIQENVKSNGATIR